MGLRLLLPKYVGSVYLNIFKRGHSGLRIMGRLGLLRAPIGAGFSRVLGSPKRNLSP